MEDYVDYTMWIYTKSTGGLFNGEWEDGESEEQVVKEWKELVREAIEENGDDLITADLRKHSNYDEDGVAQSSEFLFQYEHGEDNLADFEAETFDVEFNDWANQEMMTHGKDISFKDWAEDEGMKHGNVPITEWAQHEEESHDARYGAEEEIWDDEDYWDRIEGMYEDFCEDWEDNPDNDGQDCPSMDEWVDSYGNFDAEGFRTMGGRGFQIEFKNGYTISIMFGDGSYGDHYNNLDFDYEDSKEYLESSQAELAIRKPNGKIMLDVLGWVSPDFVAALIPVVATGDEAEMIEVIQNREHREAEEWNWGGDPEGQLATAIRKARIKAKELKKPLKIEKLDAEEGGFFQLEVKYKMEDGWEHHSDYDNEEDATGAYYDIYLKYPEVVLLEVDSEGDSDVLYRQRNYDVQGAETEMERYNKHMDEILEVKARLLQENEDGEMYIDDPDQEAENDAIYEVLSKYYPEEYDAETFEGIPKSVSDLEAVEDVRCDKYELEVNFENEDMVVVSGEELKAIMDDGWDLDSVRSFEDAGMSLLFTRNPNRAFFNAEMVWGHSMEFREHKPKAIPHIGGGAKNNGYFAIKGYEGDTKDGFRYRIFKDPSDKKGWYDANVYDVQGMMANRSHRLNPRFNDASITIGSFPTLEQAKRALVFRMIQDEQYYDRLTDAELDWLMRGTKIHNRKWKKAETSGQWEIGEQLEEAQMNAETFEASKWAGYCPTCNKWRTTDMSVRVNKDRNVSWTMPDKLYGKLLCKKWQRGGKIHQQTSSWTGYGQRFHDDSYCGTPLTKVKNAEDKKRKKISGVLSDPFDELSLDSGGIKKWLAVGIIGGLTVFGYTKWK